MAQLHSIVTYLDNLLPKSNYQDVALNGLQVESKGNSISKIALAVDSGLSVLQEAVKSEADLLIVHHGLFWGVLEPITGILANKIELLQSSKCSLYASHLPLDGNLEHGNAAEIARHLKLTDILPCFEYRKSYIGVKAKAPRATNIKQIIESFAEVPGVLKEPIEFSFGPKEIQTIGIVTGSGSSAILEAHELGLDLLISGEAKQEAYHVAKDLKMNALFLGHYATETFGVRSVGERLAKDFDLSTVFIHEPTGI